MLRRHSTLKSKLLSITLTAMLAISAVLLGSYGWSSYHLERERFADIEREIKLGISSKASALTRTQALALKGLAADNAFSDVRRLIANAVDADPDIIYGMFVVSDKVWAYSTTETPNGAQDVELRDLTALPPELRPSPQTLNARALTQRDLRAFGRPLSEYAAPVLDDEQEPLGTIIYGFSDERARKSMAAAAARSEAAFEGALTTSAAAGAIVLALSVLWILRSAGRITRPLAELTQAANDIAAGTRGVRVSIRSGDEVELLASSFNRMLENNERTMRELEITTERALSADRSKSQFLANMSHEIRTPMNGVLGVVKLIQGLPLEGKLRRYIDTIDSSANALMVIIDDVLDFSKMEAGKYELQSVAFDARDVVQQASELLASRAHDKNLELICHVHRDLPPLVVGDPDRFRQVLNNLLGNAIKFTERGEVAVELRLLEQRPTNVLAEVQVTDTGIGIDAADLPRLFEAFSQVDGSVVRRHSGTGLGLAICKRLVDMMGGTLSVESKLGAGSTFRFSVRWQLTESVGRAADEVSAATGKRVLVADPSERLRAAIQEHLTVWQMDGTGVAAAGAALQALSSAIAEGRPFDAMVFSAGLPGASPDELVGRVRALAGCAELPLVLLTASPDVELSRVGERQLLAQLSKPLRFSELYNCLTGSFSAKLERAQPLGLPAASMKSARAVLVVDDNDINRFVAVESLTQRGYRCEEAHNGREAFEKVASSEYLCVLMDCQMPEMDGYEASRAIRALEEQTHRPRTPIIALTAHAMVGERERVLEAGMDDFMSKPFRPSSLEKLLDLRAKPELASSIVPLGPSRASIPPPPSSIPPVGDDANSAAGADAGSELDPDSPRSDKLIRLFIEQTPGQLARLQTALAQGNREETRACAHRLKGSCLALGARRLAAEIEALRELAASGDLNRATGMLEPVLERHRRVSEHLRAELQRRQKETRPAEA